MKRPLAIALGIVAGIILFVLAFYGIRSCNRHKKNIASMAKTPPAAASQQNASPPPPIPVALNQPAQQATPAATATTTKPGTASPPPEPQGLPSTAKQPQSNSGGSARSRTRNRNATNERSSNNYEGSIATGTCYPVALNDTLSGIAIRAYGPRNIGLWRKFYLWNSRLPGNPKKLQWGAKRTLYIPTLQEIESGKASAAVEAPVMENREQAKIPVQARNEQGREEAGTPIIGTVPVFTGEAVMMEEDGSLTPASGSLLTIPTTFKAPLPSAPTPTQAVADNQISAAPKKIAMKATKISGYALPLPKDIMPPPLDRKLKTRIFYYDDEGIILRQEQLADSFANVRGKNINLNIALREMPSQAFRISIAGVNRPITDQELRADGTLIPQGKFPGQQHGIARLLFGTGKTAGIGYAGFLIGGPIGAAGTTIPPRIFQFIANARTRKMQAKLNAAENAATDAALNAQRQEALAKKSFDQIAETTRGGIQ